MASSSSSAPFLQSSVPAVLGLGVPTVAFVYTIAWILAVPCVSPVSGVPAVADVPDVHLVVGIPSVSDVHRPCCSCCYTVVSAPCLLLLLRHILL
jgi:hypothetical protein